MHGHNNPLITYHNSEYMYDYDVHNKHLIMLMLPTKQSFLPMKTLLERMAGSGKAVC